MQAQIKFAWEITEEGCFKFPLLKLPKQVYDKSDRQGFITEEVLPHTSVSHYDKSRDGSLWKLKPEYI